jgi:hypothetical protein
MSKFLIIAQSRTKPLTVAINMFYFITDGLLIFYNLLKLLEVVTGTFRITSLQRIDFD